MAQGDRKMNPMVMLKEMEVAEPRGRAGQAHASL